MPYQEEDGRYYFSTRIVPHREWEGYTVIYLDKDLIPILPLKKYPKLRIDGDIHSNYINAAFVPTGGEWFMYLSKQTMKDMSLQLGDLIEFSFRVADQDAVDIPQELRDALETNPSMLELWNTLTPGKKRGFSHMVRKAKALVTKQKRIQEIFVELKKMKNV